METRESTPAEAVVVMDRFVSASSAEDAVSSLEQLVNAFKDSSSEHKGDGDFTWQPAWIFEHDDIAEHLVWLLQHGTLKASESPCEEGTHLICQLYQHLIKSSDALMKPRPGLLLESLLDILDNPEQPVYVRVLALKVLEDVSKTHKSIAINQWLEAPNGLYRIADLLAIDVDNNPMEEAIRNQALIVAKSLAREAPMAKVFLFAEVDCKLLDLCWKEGGLTRGSPIVIDALELIQEVLKHADTSLQDLVWQRPNVAPRLIQLLDLRGGEEFLHPKERKSKTSKDSIGEDDLDSLLASGDAKTTKDEDVHNMYIPRLLPSEENVVKLVLNILRLLLETDSVRETVWKHQPGLCSIMWELALVSNPSDPPVCALPTASLQQEAMNLVADRFNDPIIMDRVSGLDRLLYLVCTGGGVSETFGDKLGISQSALAILRQCLSGNRIHDILMCTLAPPPTEDESAPPMGPTVVQKLWNTVQENVNAENSEERTLFLSGALGALGLMLCDEQSREIMFKVTPVSLDQILESLSDENEYFVKFSLLRFLSEWINECPFIAHKLLSSTASTNLAGMASTPSEYQPLAHLLLGLSMEYLTNEDESGGWTRNGILQIILKIGISKYTSSIEGLKIKQNQKMPWVVSEMELKNWKKFCRQTVLTIRKRVVEELAAGSGDSDDDIEDKNTASGSDIPAQDSIQGIKPLQKLVSQQSKEIEEMTIRLEAAEAKVMSQESQLNTWKRRVECTPTELDHMLNEFTSKNSDLEEKVRFLSSEIERQNSEKDREIKLKQDELLKYKAETDTLRKQDQEARDDLERTEQEMKALSQAYTSLEEEFRRQQQDDGIGVQSSENSQQLEGQSSHEQNGSGSTEVTTLRSENARLKNDARKADEWMSMAVQKINGMGAAKLELEKQVLHLNAQIEQHVNNQAGGQLLQNLEEDLENERSLRLAAEERLSYFEELQLKLENEYKRSELLQERVGESEQTILKFESLELELQAGQQRVKDLERLLMEAEEASRSSVRQLDAERNERIALETQSGAHESNKLEEVRAEYDQIFKAKDSEIETLRLSLQEAEVGEDDRSNLNADVVNSSKIVDEIRQTSQEEIYRLESVVRELKDRLSSGLGEYTVENILARDEEIEELRKANESAQEWMGKAVEHHNRNSDQIQKLSEENTSLYNQLEHYKRQNTMVPSSTEAEETGKRQESDVAEERFSALQAELEALQREKDANQGLLDELGIAMDDVAVMQQQLSEYKAIKSELEGKLSGNALSDENESLRQSNEDLQKRLSEFEDWAQVAQTKIGDIMTAKDEIESQLKDATEEILSLRNENDALNSTDKEQGVKESAIEQINEEMEKEKSANDHLRAENASKERQYEDLLQSFNDIKQEFEALSRQKSNLETDLLEQKQLTSDKSAEIDSLKSSNEELLGSLGETYQSSGVVAEIGTTDTVAERSDIPDVKPEENGATREDKDAEVNQILEELERIKKELAVAREGLMSEESISRQWEERASQLELELADVQKQMQEQESEAVDAIAKWEQNVVDLEEKCSLLEEKLRVLSEHNEHNAEVETRNGKSNSDDFHSKEEDGSFQNSIDFPESSETKDSHDKVPSETQSDDKITELREALKIAQDTLAKDEEVVQQWEERTAELELRIESLDTELRDSETEASEVISQWQGSCAEAESKCASLEEELRHLKAAKDTDVVEDTCIEVDALAQKEEELRRSREEAESMHNSMHKLKDEAIVLKAEVKEISEELANQKLEATNSIEQWKEKLDSSSREKSQLQADLQEANSKMVELQDLCSKLSADDQAALQWEGRNRELTESISLLEDQLKEQEREALDAVEQWQSACSDLEKKCIDLELLVKENREIIASRDWSVEQLKSSNEGYLNQIEVLKTCPSELESSLKESLSSAQVDISRLSEAQKIEREEWAVDQTRLQEEREAEKARTVEARAEIEKLSSRLEEFGTDSNETLLQWTVRYEELNTALTDAQVQLQEQEVEANEAISVWEMKTDELEKELDLAEDQLDRLKEILADNGSDSEVDLVLAAEKLVRKNESLNVQIEKATTDAEDRACEVRNLENQHKEVMEVLSLKEKKIQEMNLKYDEIQHQLALKSVDKLEEERDRLIGVVAQLEEEVRELNLMLQAHVTDGSIDKASEFAANAIRDDVYNMRSQLNEYQQRFEDEKAAREVADLEIERLRDDIAALLSLSDHEKSPTNMKKLTTKSIEKLQKLEHLEIDDLRKSLFRALEDLDFARSTERNTSETVSKLRLQVSIYEQEIIAAKSEVNFLSEAMEELRQTEDSKRESLEYRIRSLENENKIARKYEADELDSLRNELEQMAMEKDVIVHQLKESEKTNASLVLATSQEENIQSQHKCDIHSECVKLRIENAHLLTIAAEEKGKTERRLRELLSAQVASSELDVILEHELRLSAETALQTLKEEVGELRNGKDPDNVQQTSDYSLEKELQDLRSNVEGLKEENAKLKATMNEQSSKAKETINNLTDECRKAQAKAFKFDRDTRTEIAVQSEIAKLRILTNAAPDENNSTYEDLIHKTKDTDANDDDIPVPSAEAFDLIRKQQKEIQEERMMYSETLQEHETLLALVAQQDLEKSCLRDALVEVAGIEAANDALQRAEEFAIIRYGSAVQVSN